MKKLKVLLMICSVSICFNLAAAEYYTWVDENGVVNFAEINPQGVSAEHITPSRRFGTLSNPNSRKPQVEESTPSDEVAAEPEADAAAVDDEVAKEIAAEQARIAKIRKDNCDIGKGSLVKLQTYARIRMQDENGEERILTDAEKAARIQEARKVISENCTGGG